MKLPDNTTSASKPRKLSRLGPDGNDRLCWSFLILLLALASISVMAAQSVYSTSTMAGGRAPQGGVDGTAADASFNSPAGVAVDSNGNILVADGNNNKIRKIAPTGVVSTLAGSGSIGSADGAGVSASFYAPVAIAVGADGNIYVADLGNHKIRKITPAGIVSTLAGSGSSGSVDGAGVTASFNSPHGVAVDGSGNVFVADTYNQKIRKITPAGIVSTLAGSGSIGSADGAGVTASFDSPRAVAVDGSGSVFVADASNQKIRKISPVGLVSTLAGSGAQGSADGAGITAGFRFPYGIAVDLTGNVYVADASNHKIRRITSAGVVTTLAGAGSAGYIDGPGTAAGFNEPRGITIDFGGSVIVADIKNHRIRRVTPAGVVTTLAGVISAADGNVTVANFNTPFGVAVDTDGNVFVADHENRKIRKISPVGTVTTFAGSGFSESTDGTGTTASFKSPTGIAVGADRSLYIVDRMSHSIRKISPAGVVTTLAGSGSQGSTDGAGAAARFNYPFGVAVDNSENVYVADTYNNKIRKINAAGLVTTLAGSGSQGSADGSGTAASFSRPLGIAVDGGGNIFVADSYNYKIRKITAAGVVTTLAGSGAYGSTDGLGVTASFLNPAGVAVDTDGSVFVADSSSHAIRKIGPTGFVSTIAGTGSRGNSEGVGASFNEPLGLAVDSSGNLYVADSGNHKIRKSMPPQAQIITFPALSSKSYGESPFSVSASATSGLPVSFSIVSGPANVSGNTITLIGAGTVTVRATQAGDISHMPAPNVEQSFIVTKSFQAITFNSLGAKTFGDAPFTVSASANSGLPVSLSIVSGPATISGNAVTLTGSGTVVVRASQTGNPNYLAAANVDQSFVVRAAQTINFPPIAGKNFGDAHFGVSATASSGLPVSFTIVSGPATISGNVITLTGVGTVSVRASQAGDSNHGAAPNVNQSFSVGKTLQTMDFGSIPGKTFGDAPFPVTASATSGLPIVFSIVSGPASVSGNTITITGAGSVTVRASQAGNATVAAANVDLTFTVSKASQNIAFPAIGNRLFTSGTIIALSATASSALPVSYSVISGPATVSGTTLTVTGAGDITVKAAQVGNANYLSAPDVTVSFTVSPNTAAPSAITLSKNWFYDNAALNTEIGTLSAIDPDAGDVIAYSLVTGTGSTDNAKFSLTGSSLRKASAAFNYNTQRTASVRIRATDLAGQFYEQAILLNLIPGSPFAKFIPAGISFTQAPNYVNAVFQVVGSTGRGLNFPRSFFDPSSPDYQPDLFQVFEGATTTSSTSPIAVNESYFQVGKISDVPSKVRTVILLDNSSSIPIADLAVIKNAAKVMVDNMFDEQEIAVYSFSGSVTKIQDFLGKSAANQATLKASIDTIARGNASTNLYGSMLQMLSLPAWTESFSVSGIETGFLVALTDGADSSGSATKEQVIAKRDLDGKRIYTIGLGVNVETQVLEELQNTNFYTSASNSTALATAFGNIQRDIIDLANSFYRINYLSPKRVSNPLGTLRKMEVRLKNNTNSAADRMLSTPFNSDLFTDLEPAMYINRTVDKLTGINAPEALTISPNAPSSASAITLFPPLDFSGFTWSIGNPALAALTPEGTIGQRVIITPNGQNGTTTLTLTDTISNFTKTIPLKIGTGVTLPPQTITFPAIADRVPTSPVFTISASASSSLAVSFSLVSGPATVSGNTVTLTGSVGTVTIRANQAGNASFAAANPETRSFTVASSGALLGNWASSSGLSGPNTAPEATPFNDGVENLLKYAFNMNAAGPDVSVLTTGGTAGLPQVALDTSGAQPVLKVAFLRRKDSGLIYTPQRSDTLGTFVAMTGTPTVTSIDAQWERVTIEEPAPPATAPSKFARVQVALP